MALALENGKMNAWSSGEYLVLLKTGKKRLPYKGSLFQRAGWGVFRLSPEGQYQRVGG